MKKLERVKEIKKIKVMTYFINFIILFLSFSFYLESNGSFTDREIYGLSDSSIFIIKKEKIKNVNRLKFIPNISSVWSLTPEHISVFENKVSQNKSWDDKFINDYYRQYIGYIDVKGDSCIYGQFLLKSDFLKYKEFLDKGFLSSTAGCNSLFRITNCLKSDSLQFLNCPN